MELARLPDFDLERIREKRQCPLFLKIEEDYLRQPFRFSFSARSAARLAELNRRYQSSR